MKEAGEVEQVVAAAAGLAWEAAMEWAAPASDEMVGKVTAARVGWAEWEDPAAAVETAKVMVGMVQ